MATGGTKDLERLNKIELSTEGSAYTGTASVQQLLDAVATAYEPERTREFVRMYRGSLARFYGGEAFDTSRLGMGTIEGILNFNQIIWPLTNCIRGNVTATQPDSTNKPNEYNYTYEPNLTGANTPDAANGVGTFTVELGNSDVQAYEIPGIVGLNLTIRGEARGTITYTWTFFGKTLDDTTFTGSAAPSTPQKGAFQRSKVYVDTSWANLGTTIYTGVLAAWEWSYTTEFNAFFAADGDLEFASVDEDDKAPELTLEFPFDATFGDAHKTIYENLTTTYIRILAEGPTEMDSGQSNPPFLRIDGAYEIPEWPNPTYVNGVKRYRVTHRNVYDTTGAKMVSVVLGNTLSAFPT